MATSVWRGMISFGLVSIPIRLYAAAREKRINLHQIDRGSKTRLKQPLYCPHCKRFVDRKEVIKGYEYEKGKYVYIEPEEIKKITPESGRTMEILAFVEEREVDPIYFDSSFLALPDEKADKPYVLLLKALEETNKMAVAKVTMHQREYTVFIRARNHGLTLHTMYYQNEIASVAGYGKNYDIKLRAEEVRLAEQLVESLTSRFKPEAYKDEFQARLKELIDAKLEGKTVAPTPKREKAPVIDMMEALKRSLGEGRRAAAGGAKARPARAASGGHRQHRKAS